MAAGVLSKRRRFTTDRDQFYLEVLLRIVKEQNCFILFVVVWNFSEKTFYMGEININKIKTSLMLIAKELNYNN